MSLFNLPYCYPHGSKVVIWWMQDVGNFVLAREFGINCYTECTECIDLPPRTVITFKNETGAESVVLKSLFQQECLKRGVLFCGGQNICYSHSNADIEDTLQAYRIALEILAEAVNSGDVVQKLEREAVQPVFRQP